MTFFKNHSIFLPNLLKSVQSFWPRKRDRQSCFRMDLRYIFGVNVKFNFNKYLQFFYFRLLSKHATNICYQNTVITYFIKSQTWKTHFFYLECKSPLFWYSWMENWKTYKCLLQTSVSSSNWTIFMYK